MILLKILGGLTILTSATLIGYYFAGRGAGRMDNLTEMKKALTLLKGEVRFALTPFGEAAISIADRVLPPISNIFSQAGEAAINKNSPEAFSIWNDAVKNVKGTYFEQEDISAFISMGKSLGYLDKDMQIKSIDLLLEYIDETVNKINENYLKESRMFKSLGILGGLLIIVVLL